MANNKNEVNKGDERLENVESALSKTEIWIEKNQKIIYGIIIAILVIAGVIYLLNRMHQKKEIAASNEIFKAQMYFDNGVEKLVTMQNDSAKFFFEKALQGDGNYPGFIEVCDSYGNTKTGKLSAYYAGICCLHMGKFEEAINYLGKYNGNDDILAPLALGAMGDCYLELGKTNDAATYYMKAVNKSKNDFTTPTFLDKAGKTYEMLGDYGNALKCYKTIKRDYPKNGDTHEIERDIAKMEALLK